MQLNMENELTAGLPATIIEDATGFGILLHRGYRVIVLYPPISNQ